MDRLGAIGYAGEQADIEAVAVANPDLADEVTLAPAETSAAVDGTVELPAEALEDPDQLATWMAKSIAVAMKAKPKTKPKK